MKDKKVPKGYRRTEIGIIPEDWEVKRLGEVCNINPESLSENTPKDFEFNYIPLELIDKGKLKGYYKLKFINAPSRARRILKKGDVLLSSVRPYLMSHFYYNDYPQKAICSTGFAVIRSKTNLINKYVYYHLFFSIINKQIDRIISGSNYPAINSNDIKSFLIPLPPLPEQKAIAKVLSDIDNLIESLDKLIEKKKLIKKGAMKELLTGKKRLPGFKGQWVKKKLGEIGTTYGGLTGKKKEDFGTGNSYYIPFLNILMNIKVDTKNLEKVYIKENETQNKVKKGDLFFNTSSETPEEVGMCAVLTEDLENTYLNSFCFGYRLKDKNIDGLFLSYFINSEYGRKIFASIAQGATRYNLSKQYFNNVEILFPPTLEEQQAIARILSDMDAEIEALQKKKEKYEQIKKGVMYLLLTGKVRLKDFKTEEA